MHDLRERAAAKKAGNRRLSFWILRGVRLQQGGSDGIGHKARSRDGQVMHVELRQVAMGIIVGHADQTTIRVAEHVDN